MNSSQDQMSPKANHFERTP